MEGVPRVPMLSFPMKRSADTPHFKSRLKSFISNHYNEDPDSYSNEIHELESLRASAVHVSKDYAGCSTLKKYFCQLNFLKSRFPMNEGGTCAVSFSWYDVFSETVHGWSDVDFEMSCILFNIGALHSELGALDNRQTADGMKTSCTHFQCAAGAFSHLRHNYQKYFTPDVSPDMLNILNNVCLAQAQECILEKSLIDNRKSTITAKVSLQIVEYYSTALRIIDGMLKDAAQYSDKLIKAVKKWRKLVEMKVYYYGCIAYLYRGMQAEDQGKWGERVTMYKAAAEVLTDCQKLAKNMDKTDPIHDTLHFTQDVVGGKVAIAEKENEFIYHEKVPDLEAVMSDVKAVSLVKGIQFKFDDPQIAGADIFGRLVPMEAHEASSLYSEEKAKILRTYSRKIEEKNEALDRFIVPLQLDQLELHDSEKIPQELIDCCAALSVNQDAVKRLSDLMAKLSSLFHDVEANLEEIQDHLEDQEKKEKEYQEVVGKRPPNNIINEMAREFQKYQSAQTVAAESNKTLRDAMVMHVSNLNILMKPLPEVMKQIPKFDELEKNEEAFERMKKLSGKVSEMRKQREMLESQLRDSILNDDITKSLVVKKDEDLDTVFKDELQKHDKITLLLDQNLLAQENIIRALTEANAEYAETRKATVDLKRKRDAVIQSLISSYEAYDELTSKCNKGIEFYMKLNSNVEKLLQRVRSVCKVQNEERDINMERIIRKAQHMPGGMPPVPGQIPHIPPTSNLGYGMNMMMPGSVPGGHPNNTQYPPVPGGVNLPNPNNYPSTSSPKPSGGTHLKLKDYLAMKKEGSTAAEMLTKINNTPANNQMPPQQPPNQQVYGSELGQPQHPLASATVPPGTQNPMGARPAPVGSEDVGKGSDRIPSYQQQPTPQAPYNNFNYYNPQTPAAAGAYYPQQTQNYNPAPNSMTQQQQPVLNSYGQQPLNQSYQQPQASQTVPASVPHNHANVNVQQQQHQYPPQQNQTPPPQQFAPQPNQTPPSQQFAPQPNQTPPPTQYNQQHQPAKPNVPVGNNSQGMPSSYQSSYSPGVTNATINTNTSYASPVYSRQYPTKDPNNFSAAYSSSYGVPLSYSGMPASYPSVYSSATTPAQYPTPISTPLSSTSSPAAPTPAPVSTSANYSAPAGGNNLPSSSYYSAVYHPAANTITNATFSTGTTATPTAMPQLGVPYQPSLAAPQQVSQVPAPQSSGGQVAGAAPIPQMPQQQMPSAPPPTDTTDYTQTSFLAQYVRQNQGYLSSQSNQPANMTFPSSVNYNTTSQPHQPVHSQGYSSGQYGQGQVQQQSTNQYPQQQWGQSQQPHQPQNFQQQPSYPQQQQQPVSAATYYNSSPAPQQQHQPQAYHQPQQQNQAQAYHQQPSTPAPTPAAPPVNSSQQKPAGATGSNLDLLSDIDFNSLPSVEPLAPSPAHSASQETKKEIQEATSSVANSHNSVSATIPLVLSTVSSSHIPTSVHNSSPQNHANLQGQNKSNNKGVDPFLDPVALEKFTFDVEKFQNSVEGLAKKSLNGPTLRLDQKWKTLVDIQNATSVKRSISVARCYPMKNRFPDIMPYDQTRVPIPNTIDDYINASFVNELSETSYPIIATQAPLPSTFGDFWHMIWHHNVELVACLCSDFDLKEHVYWPKEKGSSLEYGSLKITLQSKNLKPQHVERILSVSHRDLKLSRVIVHIQFTGWTGSTFPVSPGPLVSFVKEVYSYYRQQRNLSRPVVVHCISGVGKTGVFCVLSAAIREIDEGNGIPDVVQIAGRASEQRKGIMNDKEYLRFTYHSLLYYCQDILMKRGILSAKPTFEEKARKTHIRHPSQDFLQDITINKLISDQNLKMKPGESGDCSVVPSATNEDASSSKKRSSSFDDSVSSKPKLSYDDIPASLTNIEPKTFQASNPGLENVEEKCSKKDLFQSSAGALFERSRRESEEITKDPLSSLDPLWTLKK